MTGRYRVIIISVFALWSLARGLISTIMPSSPRAVLVIYILLTGIGSGQVRSHTPRSPSLNYIMPKDAANCYSSCSPVSGDKMWLSLLPFVAWVMPESNSTSDCCGQFDPVTGWSAGFGSWFDCHVGWTLVYPMTLIHIFFLEMTYCVFLWHHFGFHRRQYPPSLPTRHKQCLSYQGKMHPLFYLAASVTVSNVFSLWTHIGQSLQT